MNSFFLKRSPWQLAIISGLLVGISYHPIHLGILAYIGFLPIFYSWFGNGPKTNFLSGYVFGIIYNLISNYWMATNSGAEFIVVLFSLISAAIYLSIFWAVAGLIVGSIEHHLNRLLMMPFLIVSLEWIRSFGPLGFTWGNLALTQMDILPILQHIEYAGTYIVAFWIVIINVTLYYYIFVNRISKEKLRLIFIISIIFIGSGWIKIILESKYDNKEKLSIAVIQPNLNPNEKWDIATRELTLNIMDSLHRKAIDLDPDFILFPETALPTYLRINNIIRQRLQSIVNQSNIPILIGTVDRRIDSNGQRLYYNSSMYIQPNQDYVMYDKIHLVPFAEYDLMPYLLHPLGELNLNIDRGMFMGGDDYTTFKFGNIKFSNLICYESSLPRYARRFVNKGAAILMIQANDGWLGNSAGPYQHFEHARLRAIENRIPVVRSGNTGISGVILPSGKVKREIPLGEQVVFKENIVLGKSGTFYTKYGDVFASLCFVIFLFIGPVFSCIKK